MDNYEKRLTKEAMEISRKIGICAYYRHMFDIELSGINYYDDVLKRELILSKQTSNTTSLKSILNRCIVTKVEINTSEIIGTYLNIFTLEGTWRLLVHNLKKFTDAVIIEGEWDKKLNRKEPLGSWDYTVYQGGYYKYFPQKTRTDKELYNDLKLLFYAT
jgi:hypothetical protein